MKRRLYPPLIVILAILLIWTIVSYSRRDVCNEFLVSLISPKSYKGALDDTSDLTQFNQNCRLVFGRYLNESGLNSLLIAQLPYRYKTFFEINKVTKVKDIQLNKLKHSNKKDYTYLYYELTYICESEEKEILMRDYFAIYLINEGGRGKIKKVICESTKSSIYKLSVEVLKDNNGP